MAGPPQHRFWESKSLAEMSPEEWESLCDGCGKCCVVKLEDVDTGEFHSTDVGCRLLDGDTCRCADYPRRRELVEDCVVLTPGSMDQLPWMPATCAYRLLNEGRPLPSWHPLETGDPESTHRAGMSVRGRIFSEETVADEDYPNHIVDWDGNHGKRESNGGKR